MPHVYADYMGAGLVHPAVARAIADDVIEQCDTAGVPTFRGNPHSTHAASQRSARVMAEARHLVAAFCGTSLDEYDVVFTSGATAALQLAARCFPFRPGSAFMCHWAAHNSLLGTRVPACRAGAAYVPLLPEDGPIDSVTIQQKLPAPGPPSLVGFPAECNWSGTVFPFSQWAKAIASSHTPRQCYSLLDAAAAAPHSHLALAESSVDLCVITFYKVLGYPTGLGALLVRRETSHVTLSGRIDCAFGGGTVEVAVFDEPFHVLRQGTADALESGTPNFHALAALVLGLRHLATGNPWHESAISSSLFAAVMEQEKLRLESLREQLRLGLEQLRHSTKDQLRAVVIYQADRALTGAVGQGPTLTFNIFDDDGTTPIGHSIVGKVAGLAGLALRTGCFCNPGACQHFLQWRAEDMRTHHAKHGHVCWDDTDVIDGRPTGAVRVALGRFSTPSDVDHIVAFIQQHFVRSSSTANVRGGTAADVVIVTGLTVYPLKGARGIRVDAWPMCRTGLAFDRQWIIVDSFSGAVVQPKSCMRLALVSPSIDAANGTMTFMSEFSGDTTPPPLSIRLDMCGSLVSPFGVVSESGSTSSSIRGRKVTGLLAYPDAVNAWFSSVLGVPVRLARAPPDTTTLANTSALLVVSESSHKAIRQRIEGDPTGLSIASYRANLVVVASDAASEASSEFIENSWASLAREDGLVLTSSGLCHRCAQVGISEAGVESAAVLSSIAMATRQRTQSEGHDASRLAGAAAVLGETFTPSMSGGELPRLSHILSRMAALRMDGSHSDLANLLMTLSGVLAGTGLLTLRRGVMPIALSIAAGISLLAAFGARSRGNRAVESVIVLRVGDRFLARPFPPSSPT